MRAKESIQIPITRIADTELISWPLPAEWVEQGSPQASGAVLSKSADSRIVRGVWACTPGRFRWTFTYDETVVVVQGSATVVMDNGAEVSLIPGGHGILRARTGQHLDNSREFPKSLPRRLAGAVAILDGASPT
jgi:uncharacterized cupin superfamily protein